ncbi:MAG: nucleotide sugar dehydrogenase [Endomicrobia bacterium]|nr:nucleotide sugar dehydrogenase [Endomicrobiia bacterium]
MNLKLFKTVKEKILNKKAVVGVIGLGYVGLPLALLISKKNYKTFGFDIDFEKIKLLKEKKSYITHISNEEILSAKNFVATKEFGKLKICDIIIICVPTPTTITNEPDLTSVVNTVETISKNLRKGQLIVLESTTYPTTTRNIVKPILEKTGLLCEKEFFLSFSPEREDPGNKNFNTEDIPKITGGIGKISTELSVLFYSQIVNKVIPVSTPEVAEAAKILENTFRAVNIAFVNELKMLFDKMNIDIWEVIEAAKTKPFGFMPFYPGPGWGGHCIPVDPFYLSYIAKKYNFYTKFIELAGEINIKMPEYVIEKIIDEFNRRKITINGSKILLLGVSYKKDIGDTRESPALRIIQLLENKGAIVDYNDPYVPKISRLRKFNITKKSVVFDKDKLKKYDCVVITTDHSCYDYTIILDNSKLIIDTRNAIRKNLGAKKKYKNLVLA